jgi:multidrug efflux pump subunit AcrA (membrane-fusion protein)
VIAREVERLQEVAAQGAIAGKTFLERKYEQEKKLASLAAQREALLMHGLSNDQVDAIIADRKLLKGLTVYAPQGFADDVHEAGETVWQVQELNVKTGQHVAAGDTLAVLTDYCTLFVEGQAFEQDAREVLNAVKQQWPVTAVIDAAGDEPQRIDDLKLAYTSGRVDTESRAFHFYVTLPNRLLRDSTTGNGHRTIDWEFKPGQRVELRLPVERLADRLVVPVDAVARDGAEWYVFQVSGNTFVRRPVHVEFRDRFSAVLANDGSVFPGDIIAISGAQQMQNALKNQSGGGVDPHAGHSH